MSHRGRRSRPLGSIRHSLTGIESVPKLPPLGPAQSIDKGYEGIHGNAMSVPPTRRSPEKEELPKSKTPVTSSRNTSSSRSEGSRSDNSATAAAAEVKRELREALDDETDPTTREKQLKSQIAALQKTIESLKAELEEKAKSNEALQEQLAKLAEQETRYKALYEKEVVQHGETRLRLAASEELVTERDRQINQLKTTHGEQLKELNIKMEKRVIEVEKAKDAEIATRDEKLKRLKNQMADALRGNSWERQQQLDELSKELTRTHEEADMLRAKLKAMAKNGTKTGVSGCANCESLSARSQHLERTISEKDKIIRELKGLGSKFEKQLSQKEIIQQLQNDRKTFK